MILSRQVRHPAFHTGVLYAAAEHWVPLGRDTAGDKLSCLLVRKDTCQSMVELFPILALRDLKEDEILVLCTEASLKIP